MAALRGTRNATGTAFGKTTQTITPTATTTEDLEATLRITTLHRARATQSTTTTTLAAATNQSQRATGTLSGQTIRETTQTATTTVAGTQRVTPRATPLSTLSMATPNTAQVASTTMSIHSTTDTVPAMIFTTTTTAVVTVAITTTTTTTAETGTTPVVIHTVRGATTAGTPSASPRSPTRTA